MRIQGFATADGTARFTDRFRELPRDHFRPADGLTLSSLGIGTYLGDMDDATDALYAGAVEAAVRGGLNVIDTAINYRGMRGERSVGTAIGRLLEAGIGRDEIFVATKVGFLPFDGSWPPDPGDYFRRTYLDTGLLRREEVVAGCHCLAPTYLRQQIDRSRENLGLATLDLLYLHNPEMLLDEIDRTEFRSRIRAAFRLLEDLVAEGVLQRYGCATWNGLRVPPDDAGHLSLEELLEIAMDVAPAGHHFRALQLPVNLGMPEAWLEPTQDFGGEMVPLLITAQAHDLMVMSSASLLQGQLARNMPEDVSRQLGGFTSDAQRALQFARSLPGVTTALVGMKSLDHVNENLVVARARPAGSRTLAALSREE